MKRASLLLLSGILFITVNAQNLFGDAHYVSPGHNSCGAVAVSDGAGFGGVSFNVLPGTTLNDLTNLATEYMFTAGGLGLGTPRFQVRLQTPGGPRNLFVYLGDYPNYTDPDVLNTWYSSGNLLIATMFVDASQLGGSFYQAYSSVQAAYGTYPVISISLVSDGGDQNIVFDNTSINSTNYTYDSNTPCLLAYNGVAVAGNQAWTERLGMVFTVNSPIVVTSLGAFDDGGNGLNLPITVGIVDMAGATVAGPITLSGSGDPLVNGHRMRPITAVTLAPGQYTVVAVGYGTTEMNGNNNVGAGYPNTAFNSNGGAITSNSSSYGGVGFGLPTTPWPDANEFHAGTFCFSNPAISIGAPTVSFDLAPGGHAQSVNNGSADGSEAITVNLCDGQSYLFSNLVHSNPSNLYDVKATFSGGTIKFNGSPAGNAVITAAQWTGSMGSYLVTLDNPAVGGSVYQTITPFTDANASGILDNGDCIGDPIVVTYTVSSRSVCPPTISFTATSAFGSASTSNGTPSTVTVNICAGSNFTLSGFSSDPGTRVGVLEKLNSSGNVTYAGGAVPADRPQADITPGGAGLAGVLGFFNYNYGPYGLSSGNTGTIDQTFTPYYDANNDGDYDAGIDFLGSPITLHYNIGFTVNLGADKTVISGSPVSSLGCTTLTAVSNWAGTYTYLWSPGGQTTQSITVCPTATTIYTVTVTAPGGCTATDEVTVNVVTWASLLKCGNKKDKVVVCHNGHEICIAPSALPEHLVHLGQGDNLGNCVSSSRGGEPELITSVKAFKLSAAPNPAVTSTRINYMVAVDSKVNITLFDVQGKAIRTLVDGARTPGEYSYVLDVTPLPAGIYYYKMTAISGDQKFSEGQKLMIVK